MRILGISGSVRTSSTNGALLRAAARLAPADAVFTYCDEQLARLPIFNPDLDGEGATPPADVALLRTLLRDADGVVISTPEYAHGVPGALKNALDWIVSSGELTDKPLVLLAASASGAPYALTGLIPTLEVLGARIVAQHSLVLTRRDFDRDGKLITAATAATVTQSLVTLSAASGVAVPA